MLCEKCKKNSAEVAVHEVVMGEERELYVCKACAGLSDEAKLAELVGLLFDMAVKAECGAVKRLGDLRCPACGITRSEFRKKERLGCWKCYEAFGVELEAMIRDMHRGGEHIGKLPQRERELQAREKLEGELRQAVATQHFEEAARLRDELNCLSGRTLNCKERVPNVAK